MPNKILSIVMVVSVVVIIGAIYWKGRQDESVAVENADLKTTEKTRKIYDKIDRKTPFSADKRAAADFVQQYTVK